MVQDNRKWRFCGYCGREHLEGPCPQYGDPRIPPKAESNRSLKATLAAERSELDRLRSASAGYRIELDLAARVLADPDYEATATDMEYWGPLHDGIQKMRKENAALREALEATLAHDALFNRDGDTIWEAVKGRARAALQGAKDD